MQIWEVKTYYNGKATGYPYTVEADYPKAAVRKAGLDFEGYTYRISRVGRGYTASKIYVYNDGYHEQNSPADFILTRLD
jgi:hypothetical protein